MFENIPPWAMQNQPQQQAFNPAPMIMSPFTRGIGNGMMAPQAPPPAQPPANASATPQGSMGGLTQMFGNPNSSNNPATASMGSGGLIQMLAALMNGRKRPDMQTMIDNQMPGGSQLPSGGGGLLDILKSLAMFR